jgi:intracellular sulfur oxidation DsrE/DsrF family protein
MHGLRPDGPIEEVTTMKLTIMPRWFPLAVLAALCLTLFPGKAPAHHTDTHFEDASAHKVVYQCNKADHAYLADVLFSVGEMIRKYGDDVEVVVVCFGPGIHLLGQIPERPIADELRQRASSLAAYGVSFHACGNTMKSLNWDEKDIVDFARVVPIGADDIMQLQEQGFSYLSW